MTVGVDRLCFGTSTFVAGRLRPGKDSAPGMAALRTALEAGVRQIHTNPNLGTQWAVRRVLGQSPQAPHVRHLVKVEAPLGLTSGELAGVIDSRIETSLQRLGIGLIHAVIVEIDRKRSDEVRHADPAEARAFYQDAAELVLERGDVEVAYGYCRVPAHVEAALACPRLSGIAATFNLAEPWPGHHLGHVYTAGRQFVAMAPLGRGTLVDDAADMPARRLAALRWVLAHPEVDAVAITMSSSDHVREVVEASIGCAASAEPARTGAVGADVQGDRE